MTGTRRSIKISSFQLSVLRYINRYQHVHLDYVATWFQGTVLSLLYSGLVAYRSNHVALTAEGKAVLANCNGSVPVKKSVGLSKSVRKQLKAG